MNEPDVCIVGAGALGLYLASRISRAGLGVAVLDVPTTLRRQVAESVRPVGSPGHRGCREGWSPGLGGTTKIWGGQLWPWEAHEFKGLADQPDGAWNEDTAAAVLRGYPTVLASLGLSDAHSEVHQGALTARQLNGGLSRGRVKHSTWMSRRQRQFSLNGELARARDAVSLLPLRVERVEPSRHGWTVVGVGSTEERLTLRARRLIVAAGTLGNFAILSRSDFGAGDLGLGQGFMDHVSAPVASFRIVRPERFRRVAAPTFHRGVLGSPRLIPAPSAAGHPGYGHWQIDVPDWVPIDALKEVLASRRAVGLSRLKSLKGHLTDLTGAATAAMAHRQRPVIAASEVKLRVDVQQPTDARNYLAYEDGEVVVRWGVHDREREAIRTIGAELIQDLDLPAMGLELTEIVEPVPEDIFHMMGGVPLNRGTVDQSGRLRAGEGGYVVGPGVFPSGGMANPTLTALSLAELVVEEICS